MTHPAGTCPNCGAPVEFQWSSAVQTVCSHCRSVLVRRDLDLTKVGVVADLPPDVSPIQIGTTGRFADAAFTVTGRIVYEYGAGTWNEWHLLFADGSSGWLSDAQLDYAISRPLKSSEPLPESAAFTTGQRYTWGGTSFAVTTLTRAHYRGVEGDLPFEYWDKTEVLFVDLASEDEQLATVDYSEAPPLLFAGQFVEFDALALKNLRPAPTGPDVKAAGFNCRNCGAAIELRALALTKTVACTSCGAIQDPSDPNIVILQQAATAQRITPTIPLGTRGTLDGHDTEVIGFQRRTIEVDDETYGWNEYLLFHREQGFRYLSEYEGHWTDIKVVHGIPRQATAGGKPAALYQDQQFVGFQTAIATTAYVLGEFPWQVRAGDIATVSDYIDPPLMLSAERTAEETTWSLGRYATGAEIWTAFKLQGDPPPAVGVYANQPSPYAGRAARYWAIFAVLAILLLLEGAIRMVSAARQPVFSATYTYQPGRRRVVVRDADLRDRPARVERRGLDHDQRAQQLDLFRPRAHQRRHGRRLRLRPRGELLLGHRQRRQLDGRLRPGRRRAADDGARALLSPGRARDREDEPAGGLHDHRAARRAVAALLSDRAGRAPDSARLRVDEGEGLRAAPLERVRLE